MIQKLLDGGGKGVFFMDEGSTLLHVLGLDFGAYVRFVKNRIRRYVLGENGAKPDPNMQVYAGVLRQLFDCVKSVSENFKTKTSNTVSK